MQPISKKATNKWCSKYSIDVVFQFDVLEYQAINLLSCPLLLIYVYDIKFKKQKLHIVVFFL